MLLVCQRQEISPFNDIARLYTIDMMIKGKLTLIYKYDTFLSKHKEIHLSVRWRNSTKHEYLASNRDATKNDAYPSSVNLPRGGDKNGTVMHLRTVSRILEPS